MQSYTKAINDSSVAALVEEEVRPQNWALASPSMFSEPVAKDHGPWLSPLI